MRRIVRLAIVPPLTYRKLAKAALSVDLRTILKHPKVQVLSRLSLKKGFYHQVRSFSYYTSCLIVCVGDRPSQALVDAFEKISIYGLHFHRTKRLPFLTRNLRKSFRKLCEELRILPNSRNLFSHGQNISLIYHYTPFVNGKTYDTYKTGIGTLQCPLCSLFGPFSSYTALQKHLQWDHEEIQVLLDQQVGEHGNRFSQISIYLRGNTLYVTLSLLFL